MIKYADVPGYTNYGEVVPFSHVYQFRQVDVDIPMIIVIHASYESKAKLFKGFLFDAKETFESVPLCAYERTALERCAGVIEQCDLDVVLAGTELEHQITGYSKIEREATNGN